MGCARAPRARVSTPGPGSTASRCRACTRGPRATPTRASGSRASVTDWGWRPRGAGCTAASGPKASKDATGCGSPPPRARATRARGLRACRMATAVRATLTEVRIGTMGDHSHPGLLPCLHPHPPSISSLRLSRPPKFYQYIHFTVLYVARVQDDDAGRTDEVSLQAIHRVSSGRVKSSKHAPLFLPVSLFPRR